MARAGTSQRKMSATREYKREYKLFKTRETLYIKARRTARVAKLVDARDLKSLGLAAVPVRVRPRAPNLSVIALQATFRTYQSALSRWILWAGLWAVGSQATLAQSEPIFEPFLSDREWAISTVDDPTGLAPTPLVQKFQLRSGDCSAKPPYDDCKANTERASLAEPITPQSRSGVNQWLRWQMYIPEDFESTYPAKTRLGEFNDHRGQETPWVLEIGSTGVLWLGRRLDDDEEYFSLVDAELLKGEWIEVVLQVSWSRKAGEFKLWVNGDARVDFKGPTCTRCDMFFSYGLSRVEIDKFRKRYPAKPLPTQTVFFTPVETAATDPGWIPIALPVMEVTPTEEKALPEVPEESAESSAGQEAAPEVEAAEAPSPKSSAPEEGADSPSGESGFSSGYGAAIIILEGEEVETSEKSQPEASSSQEAGDSNANPEPTVESVSETSVSGPSETLEPIVDPNMKDK